MPRPQEGTRFVHWRNRKTGAGAGGGRRAWQVSSTSSIGWSGGRVCCGREDGTTRPLCKVSVAAENLPPRYSPGARKGTGLYFSRQTHNSLQATYLLQVSTHLYNNPLRQRLFLSPFYRWGTEKLRNREAK